MIILDLGFNYEPFTPINFFWADYWIDNSEERSFQATAYQQDQPESLYWINASDILKLIDELIGGTELMVKVSEVRESYYFVFPVTSLTFALRFLGCYAP